MRMAEFPAKLALVLLLASSPTPLNAQDLLSGMLKAGREGIEQNQRKDAARTREHQELLARIANSIEVTPDHACTLPQREIEDRLSSLVNQHGLMDNIAQSVFREGTQARQNVSGLEASMRHIDRETAAISARNRAIYNGERAQVGSGSAPNAQEFYVDLLDIKAVNRIPNGLDCTATARTSFLKFEIAYWITLNPDHEDGWTAQLQEPGFSEADALAEGSPLRVRYGERDLTLAEARRLVAENEERRVLAAEAEQRRRQAIARNAVRCVALDRSVQDLMKDRGVEIFEITNTFEQHSENGTSCRGVAYTDVGRLTVRYGITTTPQGRQIIEAELLER